MDIYGLFMIILIPVLRRKKNYTNQPSARYVYGSKMIDTSFESFVDNPGKYLVVLAFFY
jgi:hypothetical protein